MAQLTKYASDIDGKEFATEHEQLTYDAGLRNKAKIEEFLNVHYPNVGAKAGPARAIAGKAIAKWLASETQVVEA